MRPTSIALVWLGVILGVSFLATPVKFMAPSLDLPTALEVGRVTFRMLANVEWIFAVLLLLSAFWTRTRVPWSIFVVLGIVALETLWLLPTLGARTDAIRAGTMPPPSYLHDLFIVGELLECAALVHAAWAMSRRPRPNAQGANP